MVFGYSSSAQVTVLMALARPITAGSAAGVFSSWAYRALLEAAYPPLAPEKPAFVAACSCLQLDRACIASAARPLPVLQPPGTERYSAPEPRGEAQGRGHALHGQDSPQRVPVIFRHGFSCRVPVKAPGPPGLESRPQD